MHKELSVLNKGDKIILVAPAGKVNKDDLDYGIDILKSWGLIVEIGNNIFNHDTYFSASDEKRLEDFQKALDSNEYKAIFCARGGYGSVRLVEKINWKNFIKNPKWVLGYSDITLILNKIQSLGIPCIHSPMPASFLKYDNNNTLEYFHQLLFEGEYTFSYKPNEIYRLTNSKEYKGILTGGNLTLLQTTIGTSYQIPVKDKILFLEEIDEYPYKVDRMLWHLYHSKHLNDVKGIIAGNFKLQKQENDFPFSLFETLKSFSFNNLEFIIDNFPSGHDLLNYPMVFGNEIKISIKQENALINITLTKNNNL